MKTIILGTAPTFFTGIRQKTPDYCFVACVASALLDEGYDKLQDLIVDRFSDQLKQPSTEKTGVPGKWEDNQRIFEGLGLADKVTFQQPCVAEAMDLLKKQRRTAQR